MLRKQLLLVLLSCALLAPASAQEPTACPPVALLPDADILTRFAGSSTSMQELNYQVAIERVDFECQAIPAGVEMTLTLNFIAASGPKMTSNEVAFAYFVTVTKADGTPITRYDFDLAVPFAAGQKGVRATEVLAPLIPLAPGDSAANYRLFVALSLTPEELAFNRAQ